MSEESTENDFHIDRVYFGSSAVENSSKSEISNDSGVDSEYSSSVTFPTELTSETNLAGNTKNIAKKDIKTYNEMTTIEETNASLSSSISVSPDIVDATENLLSFDELSLNKIDNIMNYTDHALIEDEELNIEELIKEAGIVCAENAPKGSVIDSTDDLQAGNHSESHGSPKIMNENQSGFSNLTTSTVSLDEQNSPLVNNIKTISKSLYSKSAENISTIDQNVDPNLNSSHKELNTETILSQFVNQKNKVTATQKIPESTLLPHKPVPESYTNIDLRYARLPKELLSQDLGSIVKNVHGIFSSVSGSLKNAYIHQRAHKPAIKNVVKPVPNGKVMNDIFEDESSSMITVEKPLEIPIIDEAIKLSDVEGSEQESNAKRDVLKLQVEMLERLLCEQRKENTCLREQVKQLVDEVQEKDHTSKEVEAKLDLMSKRVEQAEREKDAAVMRYASVECTAIEARRAAEKASAAEKAALAETELLANKLKSAHAEKQRICQLYDDKVNDANLVAHCCLIDFNKLDCKSLKSRKVSKGKEEDISFIIRRNEQLSTNEGANSRMFRKEGIRKKRLNEVITLVLSNILYVTGRPKNSSLIYILLATELDAPFRNLELERYSFIHRKCEYQNCFLTNEQDYLDDVIDFDVVMFNAVGVRRKHVHIPPKRSPHQKYVFCSQESSTNYPLTTDYDDFINWTWTYKLNSDIVCPYIAVRNTNGDLIGPKPDMTWMRPSEMKPTSKTIKRKLRHKRIAAAWFVSHCGARSLRLDFVRQLNRELTKYGHRVDVYGECGNLTCPLQEMEDCYAYIETDYYFYLAFENSFAVDYVSEKLLTAVEHFAVPIVFGGADYSRFMPHESYIDARKFGPELLAKEMVDIINNKQRYIDYFRWHRYYSLHDTDENPETDVWCIFCKYLNDNLKLNKTTTYPELVRWYNEPRDWPPRLRKETNEPNVFVKFFADIFDYFGNV